MGLDAGQIDRGGRLVANCLIDGVPSGSEVEVHGARWLNLSTSDVLGLAGDARVKEATLLATRKLGLSAQIGSQTQLELEAKLAKFLNHSEVLIASDWPSVLRCLPTWACAIDGRSRGLAHDATSVVSAEEAETLVAQGQVFGLIVEGLHPHEGDLAPLPRYAEICERFGATLIVSDPCGLGALGPTGAGVVEHLGVHEQTGLHVAALGAALPGSGVVLSGAPELIHVLRGQLGVPLTAPLAGTSRALDIALAEPVRRTRMFELAQRLLTGFRSLGFDTGPCVTPWIPLWLGDQTLCQQWLDALADASFAARAWVAPGASRLLVSLSATATDSQASMVLTTFERLARKLKVPEVPAHVRAETPLIARPGTYSLAAGCAPHWFATARINATIDEPTNARTAPLVDRVYDTLEQITWRATNASGRSIRRTADALRAVLDRRRKP